MRFPFVLLWFSIILALTATASAQVPTGTPPFGSFGGGPFDVVNLGNLNSHFNIPVIQKAGRGVPYTYSISFDTSVWYPTGASGSQKWTPASGFGWNYPTPTGYLTYALESTFTAPCNPPNDMTSETYYALGQWIYHDPRGNTHPFSVTNLAGPPECNNNTGPMTGLATDGSGYTLTAWGNSGTVASPSGLVLNTPTGGPGVSTTTDANGNQVTVSSSGTVTDTLGQTVLSMTGTNPLKLTYTAPNGSPASFTVNYTTKTVQTAFGCSGITDYPATSAQLVTSIVLPDNTSYGFSYEATPGYSAHTTARLTKVTLPTGGSITYTYSGANDGVVCADGSTLGLSRTLSPGGTWQYTRTKISGAHWQTTVTSPPDPMNSANASDVTNIDFQQDGNTTFPTQNFYETQRKVYQGSTSGTLLSTFVTCYNAKYANCVTTGVSTPITQRDAYTQLPNGNTSLSELLYSPYSPVVTDKEYTYGVTLGSAPSKTYLVRETDSSYTIIDNPPPPGGTQGSTIVELSSVSVSDWSSGTQKVLASTAYSYDGTTTIATTDTPQHVEVTGARGNLTTVANTVNGNTTLYKVLSYYDTGNIDTASDFGTAYTGGTNVITFNYGACGNSFPTNIQEPSGLSLTYTWNCIGGVMLTATDPNNNTTTSDYSTDAHFWRPDYTLDQLNNKTSLAYTGQTAVESSLPFNNNHSVSDIRTTVDGFGRPLLNQKGQTPTPTEYDSTETDYNIMGQSSRSTMPFEAAASVTNSTVPSTTTAYDALGRPILVTDGGGRTVSYKYINNDVLQTVGPTQNFTKQLEYDGLGRLTSVCEITAATGSGPCLQSNGVSGYWTRYTYDAIGNLLTVTQNAQTGAYGGSQQRAYIYDGLNRLTLESNPESGTTKYFYDSYAGMPNSPGDLIALIKQNTDGQYFYYDDLHRPTVVAWSGPDAYFCKRFLYDNTKGLKGAIPPGVTVSNMLGRLAEAETDNCVSPQATTITDEWFSYDADGNPTDLYESTPHSSGYYHAAVRYWPNGGMETLGLFDTTTGAAFMPNQTYGPDGEGRPTTVTAASGQNPVTAVTYTLSGTTEPIGSLTNVTFGSSDSDSYQYNPNTGRMTQYSFNVNGKSAVGTQSWNPNGTLQQLAITDPFNIQDNQTCTNTYDDLARVSGNTCGNTWAQTFGYDAFGNIAKSGSISWGCLSCYTYSTNRYNTVANEITYDTNGNLLADSFNTYTWDVYGDLASANGKAIVYDAFGRMVENSNGGNQFAYTPTGTNPFASLQGQVLQGAFVPLPGGAVALYNSSGLSQYNHADWLGSARLFSNPSRTAIPAMSYAPFGEGYAGGQGYVQFTATGNAFTVYDTENQSGSLTDFTFRRYAPVQGRWISPDPAGLAAVDPSNPQSWNRYAYVLNGPLSFTDPLGLCTGTMNYTVDYGNGNTEALAGTINDGTPFPCTPPPPGCQYVSAGGSGAGSQWTGMQCNLPIPANCPPNAVIVGAACTGVPNCPPGANCQGSNAGGSGGGAPGPPSPLTNQQFQQLQQHHCTADDLANSVDHANQTFVSTFLGKWRAGTVTPIALGCLTGGPAGCSTGLALSIAGQPLIMAGAAIWGSYYAYKEAFTNPTGTCQ